MTHTALLIGCTVRNGPSTGSSGFSVQSFLKCRRASQLSKPSARAAAFAASTPPGMNFGRNLLR